MVVRAVTKLQVNKEETLGSFWNVELTLGYKRQ